MEKTDGGESAGGRSRSESNGTHYLAKCVLKGSVVLQALYGRFRSPFSYDVVFGRETSLELATIDEDGIVQSVCEQSMFGTIKDLMLGKDLLVVLSDSGKLTFLSFSTEMHRFFPLAHIQISRPGNSRHQLGRMLTIDSNQSTGRAIMPSGEAERDASYKNLESNLFDIASGMVVGCFTIFSYLDAIQCKYVIYVKISELAVSFHLYGFLNENPQRMRRFASARTRFTITALATCYTRIVVGDCRDGVLFFFYQEDQKKLEQLFCDPVQRLVADCALMDPNTVVVSDRRETYLSCHARDILKIPQALKAT
ncbi:hypothetical protein QJS10_CPB19g00834 [Acorus calamus]|uniref:Cleavage/polyadenylation specificity factor A subunit C-terminal domain-containing protein n=1 Tax=Acorus calamus TaxID=4465 RepID=A0AAV9CE58_ACOCL|nr:hypothetical protein QJS10_CPB19g00834 [Acorus calamus]